MATRGQGVAAERLRPIERQKCCTSADHSRRCALRPLAAGEVGYLANAQVHAQVVLLFSFNIRILRADLWSIRGTIHLENDDSWINRPFWIVQERTPCHLLVASS